MSDNELDIVDVIKQIEPDDNFSSSANSKNAFAL